MPLRNRRACGELLCLSRSFLCGTSSCLLARPGGPRNFVEIWGVPHIFAQSSRGITWQQFPKFWVASGDPTLRTPDVTPANFFGFPKRLTRQISRKFGDLFESKYRKLCAFPLCLFLSFSHSFFLSFSVPLFLFPSFSVSVFLFSLFLSVSPSLFLSVSLPLRLIVSLSLSLYLSLSLSLCLFLSLCLCFSLSLCQSLSVSVSLFLFVCQSLSVSLSVSVCLSVSVSLSVSQC